MNYGQASRRYDLQAPQLKPEQNIYGWNEIVTFNSHISSKVVALLQGHACTDHGLFDTCHNNLVAFN